MDKNLDPTTDDASEDPDEDHRSNVEEYVDADPHKADGVVLPRTLNGHADEVYGVVFSPDGHALDAIEPAGPIERFLAGPIVAAYKRRLRAIVAEAPE